MNIGHDLLVLAPELILAIGSMAALMIGAVRGDKETRLISILMALLMFLAGCVVVFAPAATAFNGTFVVDAFSRFAKVLILGSAALCIIMAQNFFESEKNIRFEMPILIGLSTVGMMLMVSASSFIANFSSFRLLLMNAS